MIVGPKRVLFMDEISTGLDSSTTYTIIKYLRDSTHCLNYTTAIALLQPAPETYDLFDDILLIAEGYLVYHGPREHVLDFFEPLGFRCPERKGVADFLQEVTSRKDQKVRQTILPCARFWCHPLSSRDSLVCSLLQAVICVLRPETCLSSSPDRASLFRSSCLSRARGIHGRNH